MHIYTWFHRPFAVVSRFTARGLYILLLTGILTGQQPTTSKGPTFDVVSIHPVPPNAPMTVREQGFTPVLPGGQYIDSRTPLYFMVAFAYNVPSPDRQLVGLPNWAKEQAFSVAAKAAESSEVLSESENRERVRAMLRAMLEDRFRLRLHTETRQIPVFNLVIAGRGSRLKEVAAPVLPEEKEGRVNASWSDAGVRIIGKKVTVTGLANVLSLILDRPVLDQTGLTGYYDIDETWTSPGPSPDVSQTGFGETGTSLVIGALQDQLGLRLVSGRSPMQYWVVDSVQLPSEN